MSSAITFYFKEIFPTFDTFNEFMTEYEIINMEDPTNLTFARYIFKLLFRQYHNSNVQYDTPEDFKCDLANILEDEFSKYQKQVALTENIYNLSQDELTIVSTALASSANNPNIQQEDPTTWLSYVGAQAYTSTKNGKLQAYLLAIKNIPTKNVGALLTRCSGLFKQIIPDQIFIFEGVEIYDNNKHN